MNREDIIRMAREAGFVIIDSPEQWNESTKLLERFAALVAAHEREKLAQWMIKYSYATGHGDTVEDLLKELDWQIQERTIRARGTEAKAYTEEVSRWARGEHGV